MCHNQTNERPIYRLIKKLGPVGSVSTAAIPADHGVHESFMIWVGKFSDLIYILNLGVIIISMGETHCWLNGYFK